MQSNRTVCVLFTFKVSYTYAVCLISKRPNVLNLQFKFCLPIGAPWGAEKNSASRIIRPHPRFISLYAIGTLYLYGFHDELEDDYYLAS